MEYRDWGTSGLRVSRVSFGTMTFGSQVASEADAGRMIGRCLDAGINLFDTADMYNQGKAEELLGKAIAGKRDRIVLASKVRHPMGDDPANSGLSRRWIMRAIEGSLRRLGTDTLDIYFLHQPDDATPLEETVAAVDELIRTGKARALGVSNYAAWQVCRMLWIADRAGQARPTVAQMMYNPIARGIEGEFIPFAREFKVALMTYNPLAGGLLTGKHDVSRTPPPGSRFHNNEMYQKRYWHAAMFRAVSRLQDVAARAGKTPVQLSLQWQLAQPAVDSVILGASSMEQLEENLRACEGTLGAGTLKACGEVWAELRGPIPLYHR